ncbi:MAG TPA: type VI secretion system contractile sheath small subunit [Pseudomonadota bacterium]|nr:type VI secretion system contractile sheath small subunit [Pseudomonadota bacterium]
MSESTQHKLDRVRPPRVQITYDVEIGDAIQTKELPFVVGVLADLAGQQDALPKLKERKLVQIDRDNFNQVLANISPRLKYKVPNLIKKDGSSLGVDLTFNNLDDFHPTAVVKNVQPLRELLEMRQRLVDLLTKLDGNGELQEALLRLLSDKEKLSAAKALAAKSETGQT